MSNCWPDGDEAVTGGTPLRIFDGGESLPKIEKLIFHILKPGRYSLAEIPSDLLAAYQRAYPDGESFNWRGRIFWMEPEPG